MTRKRKIQHYIPQFYLRAFSRNDKGRSQVFCFDKKTGAKFLAGINRIGAESYFYDVAGRQKAEEAFSELEGKMSSSYRNLLKSRDVTMLSKEDRIGIAVLIATQHMRTRGFRNIIREATEYILQQTRNLDTATGDQPLEQIEEFAQEEPAKRLQFTLIATSIPEFASLLLRMKWILFINEGEMPFWCSDNPFTYSNIFRYDKYDGLGFERLGSQTHFPLSPKLSLEIVDPVTYLGYPNIIHIDDMNNVVFNNHLQVKNAQRYIFSSTDDFSLAEEMIRKNPELSETDKNRFEIEKPKLHERAR